MTNEEQNELLEEARWALAQALRQWAMYANDRRHEPDDVDLGNADTLEDHSYSRAMSALKRLGAAADESGIPWLARKTAFDCSAWLDLLAVGWEAEADVQEGRLVRDPLTRRLEDLTNTEYTQIKTDAKRLRDCASELRQVVVGGLASKSNSVLNEQEEHK